MWREIPGVIVYILFLAGFVLLMNFISSPSFGTTPASSNTGLFYTLAGAGIVLFTILMVYWEHIFPAGD